MARNQISHGPDDAIYRSHPLPALRLLWGCINHMLPIGVEALPWASYQIRNTVGCACAGNAGNVFPTTDFQRKPLVSDPDMHYGMFVTHVSWCMSGSLTHDGGENVPGISSACTTLNFTFLARGPCQRDQNKPDKINNIMVCQTSHLNISN